MRETSTVPIHTDECHHDPGEYRGSIYDDGRWYDAYVFSVPLAGDSVCFRFSSDAPDYISPGNREKLERRIAEWKLDRPSETHPFALLMAFVTLTDPE